MQGSFLGVRCCLRDGQLAVDVDLVSDQSCHLQTQNAGLAVAKLADSTRMHGCEAGVVRVPGAMVP